MPATTTLQVYLAVASVCCPLPSCPHALTGLLAFAYGCACLPCKGHPNSGIPLLPHSISSVASRLRQSSQYSQLYSISQAFTLCNMPALHMVIFSERDLGRQHPGCSSYLLPARLACICPFSALAPGYFVAFVVPGFLL